MLSRERSDMTTTLKNPLLGLAHKRALVTGEARGIGAAIALKLAEDGADIAITYERSAGKAAALVPEIRALGRAAVAIQADSASIARYGKSREVPKPSLSWRGLAPPMSPVHGFLLMAALAPDAGS